MSNLVFTLVMFLRYHLKFILLNMASTFYLPFKEYRKITLKVPPYVFQFLMVRYGAGPYDLLQENYKRLKISFLYWGLKAAAQPPIMIDTECLIKIEILLPHNLIGDHLQVVHSNLPNRYTFFYTDFWQAAIFHIEGQLATNPKIPRWEALENFLALHEIPEDIYPIDSAYRQLTRFLTKGGGEVEE